MVVLEALYLDNALHAAGRKSGTFVKAAKQKAAKQKMRDAFNPADDVLWGERITARSNEVVRQARNALAGEGPRFGVLT